ncbi:2-succinyl-6-hydroxy-2,4-cyclohexadiene-1-carboxylate synthase [Lysinibacillus yapensis]|uniref:Putative 2-succinyl-6-hydroxy-2,4-cyclohexadiene-1-carboxylate synthase n=1 Tax=Ureibacillus yapensis TaxID=2304605 RepID=A0A396S4A3_9BACL|nr:2-succinyl-6-hydroxy-2,4-cyclohexadiene-1-carboxylate synthase [Lysinibacillus yapensis]RHW33277.1 2-succinyl-6-hydroxy-2,4-cyclohexadiene-1-carboxylate synthase [Lysinibacillus yapensis]
MIIQARSIRVNVRIWNDEMEQTIVMLHGFTGSVATWEKVAFYLPDKRIVAIDLVGHGKTESPENTANYTMEEQVLILEELFQQLNLNQFILLGYSMGGRVALSYTAAFPKRVQQLVLESASPGLKTEDERIARRKADAELANRIEQHGVEAFVNQWENIPLFATQKNLPLETQQAIRTERLSQIPTGLANSLRGMGTGSQKSLWPSLKELIVPVTLITGELDEKFCKIAVEMQALLPIAQYFLVKNVGHAIHVENPLEFATIVKEVSDKNNP